MKSGTTHLVASDELVAEYSVMAVMERAAFLSLFGERGVATIGGLGMLPVAGLAVARLVGHRT